MQDKKRDHIAEAIADYDALTEAEKGKLLINLLEDQPYLMGFITNVADDFSEAHHEALVNSTIILINAFIAAGMPFALVPAKLLEEVISEKSEQYAGKNSEDEQPTAITDSPLVFEDLHKRAIIKAGLTKAEPLEKHNFSLMLDVIITIVERMVDYQRQRLEKEME